MMKRLFNLFILLVFLFSSGALYSYGTRAIGMGMAYYALSDDSDGVFFNPAGLVNILPDKSQASVMVKVNDRDLETLDLIFSSGVDHVILGSIAIKDKELFRKACTTFPDKIILGIDAINGFLAAEAWTEASKLSASDLISSYKDLPIKSIIYTDINKDGMLSGPNLEETSEVAKLSPFPVIASGGVKDINDLTNLSKIPNVIGAICGVSLYENKINFKEALQMF
jgi:phosphoribosylformimino-5-aminoimidazole carboxamide ribotide isomerase